MTLPYTEGQMCLASNLFLPPILKSASDSNIICSAEVLKQPLFHLVYPSASRSWFDVYPAPRLLPFFLPLFSWTSIIRVHCCLFHVSLQNINFLKGESKRLFIFASQVYLSQ